MTTSSITISTTNEQAIASHIYNRIASTRGNNESVTEAQQNHKSTSVFLPSNAKEQDVVIEDFVRDDEEAHTKVAKPIDNFERQFLASRQKVASILRNQGSNFLERMALETELAHWLENSKRSKDKMDADHANEQEQQQGQQQHQQASKLDRQVTNALNQLNTVKNFNKTQAVIEALLIYEDVHTEDVLRNIERLRLEDNAMTASSTESIEKTSVSITACVHVAEQLLQTKIADTRALEKLIYLLLTHLDVIRNENDQLKELLRTYQLKLDLKGNIVTSTIKREDLLLKRLKKNAAEVKMLLKRQGKSINLLEKSYISAKPYEHVDMTASVHHDKAWKDSLKRFAILQTLIDEKTVNLTEALLFRLQDSQLQDVISKMEEYFDKEISNRSATIRDMQHKIDQLTLQLSSLNMRRPTDETNALYNNDYIPPAEPSVIGSGDPRSDTAPEYSPTIEPLTMEQMSNPKYIKNIIFDRAFLLDTLKHHVTNLSMFTQDKLTDNSANNAIHLARNIVQFLQSERKEVASIRKRYALNSEFWFVKDTQSMIDAQLDVLQKYLQNATPSPLTMIMAKKSKESIQQPLVKVSADNVLQRMIKRLNATGKPKNKNIAKSVNAILVETERMFTCKSTIESNFVEFVTYFHKKLQQVVQAFGSFKTAIEYKDQDTMYNLLILINMIGFCNWQLVHFVRV